jgi:hypothetical protein
MTKLYVHDAKRSTNPEQPYATDFLIRSDAANAKPWPTIGLAESARIHFGKTGLNIHGHICRNFQIEERATNEFIIFCEVPDDVAALVASGFGRREQPRS